MAQPLTAKLTTENIRVASVLNWRAISSAPVLDSLSTLLQIISVKNKTYPKENTVSLFLLMVYSLQGTPPVATHRWRLPINKGSHAVHWFLLCDRPEVPPFVFCGYSSHSNCHRCGFMGIANMCFNKQPNFITEYHTSMKTTHRTVHWVFLCWCFPLKFSFCLKKQTKQNKKHSGLNNDNGAKGCEMVSGFLLSLPCL